MSGKVFEKTIKVYFGHCDPAGIVYHPHYFAMINQLMEDFLNEVCGVGFIEIRKYGVGFPVVNIKTEFPAASKVGDLLTGRVWMEKLGDSSLRFAFTLHAGDELRVKCTEACVCVKEKDGKFYTVPLPEEMRSQLTPYLADENTPALTFR